MRRVRLAQKQILALDFSQVSPHGEVLDHHLEVITVVNGLLELLQLLAPKSHLTKLPVRDVVHEGHVVRTALTAHSTHAVSETAGAVLLASLPLKTGRELSFVGRSFTERKGVETVSLLWVGERPHLGEEQGNLIVRVVFFARGGRRSEPANILRFCQFQNWRGEEKGVGMTEEERKGCKNESERRKRAKGRKEGTNEGRVSREFVDIVDRLTHSERATVYGETRRRRNDNENYSNAKIHCSIATSKRTTRAIAVRVLVYPGDICSCKWRTVQTQNDPARNRTFRLKDQSQRSSCKDCGAGTASEGKSFRIAYLHRPLKLRQERREFSLWGCLGERGNVTPIINTRSDFSSTCLASLPKF